MEVKVITGASDVILRVNISRQSGYLSLGVRGNESWAKHVASDGSPLRALYKEKYITISGCDVLQVILKSRISTIHK